MTDLTTNQIELLRLAAGADDGACQSPGDAKMVRSLIKRGLLLALPQAKGRSRLIINEAGRAASRPRRRRRQRADGATVAAMAAATGWQNHSVRGAMSGALKKKLGLSIESEKSAGGRVYRVRAEARA